MTAFEKKRTEAAKLARFLPLAKAFHAIEAKMYADIDRRQGVEPTPGDYADPWAAGMLGDSQIYQQVALLKMARDLASELAALGHVIVPAEPTAEMVACLTGNDTWNSTARCLGFALGAGRIDRSEPYREPHP